MMRGLKARLLLVTTLCAAASMVALADDGQPAAGTAEAPAEKAPHVGRALLDVGWGGYDLRGVDRKLRQYATPAHGLYVKELRYQLLDSPRLSAALMGRGLGADDLYTSGVLAYDYGRTRIDGSISRYHFLAQAPYLIDDSTRRTSEFQVRQALTREFGLSMSYRMDTQDQYYAPPSDPKHQRTRYWDAVAQGTLGNGNVGLSYSDWRFMDRTTQRVDSAVSRAQLRYNWEPCKAADIEAMVSHARIQQPLVKSSHVETMSLVGDLGLGGSTDLNVRMRRDTYDLPNAVGQYLRESRLASARLTHRWRNWSGQLGVRESEVERVTSDHLYVDVPRWWTFDGRLSGKLSKVARLTVSGSNQHLVNGPSSLLSDIRPLNWTDRTSASARIEGSSGDTNSYLVASFRRWSNGERDAALTTRAVTAGATWDVIPQTSLHAEYTREGWWAKSGSSEWPAIDNFAPNSTVLVTGLTWVADRNTFVWCNYTDYVVDNDNPLLLAGGNTHARYLTLTVEHKFRSGCGVSLTVAPWYYHDRVSPSMNYDTRLVMLSGNGKF